ncbi:MAG: TetR family transcriptional regulator C-terminal domain-containing protein [Pseudomonadales bacterium]|jgi:TetR/AcrR family transcriptional repressor of bet genes|nr:TetR family transcriptional regulator C-terminal domain-containing protein [Gammaproteobacteria bacterium]MBP6050947.1 TetR family transcriptional regulator C-terminal domain-containing protein [Pseudomonadales bacterium]MBK6582454.1 TetR family transcriptional regulator C-terminal domain-containing protein [Gammaproteobacteria bacterium]MBK7169599.1 TetR family transcriptional regulator C-terminal domain-containing protein [Gammaproteobacteria bacterium]MBK7521279.1 TetR family transcriptio
MAVGAADIAAVPSDGVGGNSLTRGAGKRDAARERRRSQLIAATIKCISRSGLAGVTMQEITREAGLSLGIVNLHFDTKQKLLIETLRSIAEEYRAGWRRILDGDRSAAERLAALVDFDFSTRVVQRGKLSVWFAFWGETKTRPTYRRICAEVDRAIDEELCGLCTQLVAEGGYSDVEPKLVAVTYSALTNGLWLDILVCPEEMDRKGARRICLEYLARIFPRHFDRGS